MSKNINKLTRELYTFVRSSNPALILFALIVFGILTTLSSLIIFLKIRSEIFEKEFVNFDLLILHSLYSIRTPELTTIMKFITNFGGNVMIFIWVSSIIFLVIKKHVREAVLLGFVFSMAVVLNGLIKLIIQRPRPLLNPLVQVSDYSFPSGHAMNSIVFYLTLSYLVYHFTKNKNLAIISTILATTLAILIGFSRIYLGVHYFTDVVAGYAAGIFWLASIFLIQKTLIFFRLFRESRSAN